MTNQLSGKQIAMGVFTNIVTYGLTAFFIAIFTLISFLIRHLVDVRELFLNNTVFSIWIGFNILAICFAIFGICYILINRRKPQEFISDYSNFDSMDRIHCKVKIIDSIYFDCYTSPPNKYTGGANNPQFAKIIYFRGPYCIKCGSYLIPKINPITKKCKYYYCSVCNKNIFLNKKYKSNFQRKIKNLALSELKKEKYIWGPI